MNRDEFVNRSWKAYQEIEYQNTGMAEPVMGLLVSVDFDREIMILHLIGSEKYIDQDYYAHIKFCKVPFKKMKPLKSKSKK